MYLLGVCLLDSVPSRSLVHLTSGLYARTHARTLTRMHARTHARTHARMKAHTHARTHARWFACTGLHAGTFARLLHSSRRGRARAQALDMHTRSYLECYPVTGAYWVSVLGRSLMGPYGNDSIQNGTTKLSAHDWAHTSHNLHDYGVETTVIDLLHEFGLLTRHL